MIRRVFSKWLWLFSLIISLANIVVVCLYLPAGYDPDFDYLGLIVGSFSILVTVLIGWNIYTLVDFKENIKQMKDIKEEVVDITEQAVLDTKLHLFNYLEFINTDAKNSEWLYIMLNNGAELIVLGEQNEDTELVNNLKKKIAEIINNNKNIALSEEQKNDIISELKDSSLINAVASIPKQPSNENRLVAKKTKKKQVLFRPKYMD